MNVSVVIPVYNAEKYIEKAVLSALQQPETLEVLLADDGSSDNSRAICSILAEKYPKVRLLMHPGGANKGTPASRNLGIRQAKGDYISLLDNDDFYLPGRFTKAKELFEADPGIDGVYEAVGTYPYDDQSLDKHLERMKNAKQDDSDLMLTTISKALDPEELFRHVLLETYGWMHINGVTIKRSAIEKIGGFDEDLLWCEDIDFFYRLSYHCRLVAGRISEPVAMRGVYDGNRTLSAEGFKKGQYYRTLLFKKMFDFMLKHELDRESARRLFRRYLDFYDTDFVYTPLGMRRKFRRFLNLSRTLVRYPRCIGKII